MTYKEPSEPELEPSIFSAIEIDVEAQTPELEQAVGAIAVDLAEFDIQELDVVNDQESGQKKSRFPIAIYRTLSAFDEGEGAAGWYQKRGDKRSVYKAMSEKTGASVDSVRKSLVDLEQKGVVEIKRTKDKVLNARRFKSGKDMLEDLRKLYPEESEKADEHLTRKDDLRRVELMSAEINNMRQILGIPTGEIPQISESESVKEVIGKLAKEMHTLERRIDYWRA